MPRVSRFEEALISAYRSLDFFAFSAHRAWGRCGVKRSRKLLWPPVGFSAAMVAPAFQTATLPRIDVGRLSYT